MTARRALLLFLLAGALVAQAPRPAAMPLAAPGVALGALASEHRPSAGSRGGGCDIRCTPCLCAPGEVVADWWYWNRSAWLPRPVARAASEPAPAAADCTAAAPAVHLDRSWLLAVARGTEPEERALGLAALGAGGAPLCGLATLVSGLDDGVPQVREAAILALGEHGGTAARFALLRAAQDVARGHAERALCVLAYEVAAAADGGKGLAAVTQCVQQAGADAGTALRREMAFAGGLLAATAVPGLEAGAQADGPMEVLQAFAGQTGDGAALQRLRDAGGLRSLAALVGAIDGGSAPADQLRGWLQRPAPGDRAVLMLALAEHPAFHAIAETAFAQASLRGVAALALAVHGRRFGRVGIVADLARAERRFAAQVDQPTWWIAQAIAGDAIAATRARLALADERAPRRLREAALDVLAIVGGEMDAVRYAVLAPSARGLRPVAADVLARCATPADVDLLVRAIATTEDAAERGELLVALGRTRMPGALPRLRAAAGDSAAAPAVRRGALRGLVLWLRATGAPAIEALPRGVRFVLCPDPVLQAVQRLR